MKIRTIAATTIVVAAALLVNPASAQAAKSLPVGDFVLNKMDDNEFIPQLDQLLPNVTVAQVLTDANRQATRIQNDPAKPIKNFAAGFAWNDDDNGTGNWYPQGITTSSDAYDNGTYEGRKMVLVSWYDRNKGNGEHGTRVSFVDRTDPANPRYRHVLLVTPVWNGELPPTFVTVPIHAGGMFLYGNLLYVADTSNGLRVFDLDHLWKVSTDEPDLIGRAADGRYHAFGYKYVLPQLTLYQTKWGSGPPPGGYLRYSFASLDRSSTPDSFVLGEYKESAGSRLVRWNIDHTTRRPFMDAGGTTATSDWAYQVDVERMQGAQPVDGKFFISQSDFGTDAGNVLTWVPGQQPKVYPDAVPRGPEDLTYRKSADEMWTLTEHPGGRKVFAMTAARFN